MNDDFNYVDEAHLTLSPDFHGEMVANDIFSKTVDDAIAISQRLDHMKKALFYGRNANLQKSDVADSSAIINLIVEGSDLNRQEAINLVHGVIGMATEAGELLEMLRNAYNGFGVDRTNIKEEVGDTKWYMAILAPISGFLWGDDEKLNIAKLRKRFPNKFTAYDANNRKLAEERKLLEGGKQDLSKPVSERTSKMPGERNQDGDAIAKQT